MAFEALQRAWDDARTLHRDSGSLVVDKPAGVPCGLPGAGPGRQQDPQHGDAAEGLLQRLARHGLGEWQALLAPPERASGIAWLAPRAAGAAGEGPAPELQYVVAVENWDELPEGKLRWSEAGREFRLEYRVRRRRGKRVLIEIETRWGPEVLARGLVRCGHRIVGDGGAGAREGTRLLLHLERVRHGTLDVSAPLPVELESWLCGAAQRSPEHFAEALLEGSWARSGLWPSYQAYRLLDEGAGEIAGVSVERYLGHAVLALSSEQAWHQRERMAACLMDHGAQGVYVKRRLRADLRNQDVRQLAPPLPLLGAAAPDSMQVREAGLSFCVQLADGLSTGLFLDQRSNWMRVRSRAKGASLLNLFSYTGAFSVAAAAGGAAATTSVDLSGRALSRAGRNLELNELSGERHRLLKSDVVRWLERALRAGRKFSWIVLDPPSFGTRAKGVLRADRDYAGLVRSALGLLEPGGQLLCVSHQLHLSSADLAHTLRNACQESGRVARLETWVGGWDCATLPGVSPTKSVLAKLQ